MNMDLEYKITIHNKDILQHENYAIFLYRNSYMSCSLITKSEHYLHDFSQNINTSHKSSNMITLKLD